MTNEELFNLLESLEIPVALNNFDEPNIELPFIVYSNLPTDTFKADDLVYTSLNNYNVFLCSSKKDIALEEKIERIFNNNHIPFEKEENYLESEKIYQIEYTI